MSREIEILSALETQNSILMQAIHLLESINDKLGDIDTNLVSLTGYGTDTISDIKGALDEVRNSVENLSLT